MLKKITCDENFIITFFDVKDDDNLESQENWQQRQCSSFGQEDILDIKEKQRYEVIHKKDALRKYEEFKRGSGKVVMLRIDKRQ